MKQARWIKGYVGLIREPKLSPGARITLLVLRSHCQRDRDSCWPSVDTIAASVGCKRRQVSRYLKELERKKWIKRKYRRRRDQAFMSTSYTLLDERKSLSKEAFPVGHICPTENVGEWPDEKYGLEKGLQRKIVNFP